MERGKKGERSPGSQTPIKLEKEFLIRESTLKRAILWEEKKKSG